MYSKKRDWSLRGKSNFADASEFTLSSRDFSDMDHTRERHQHC